MTRINVGDRVMVTEKYPDRPWVGKVGTVVNIRRTQVSDVTATVEFGDDAPRRWLGYLYMDELVRVAGKRQKVYLAGPMTGIPEYNFPAFREATEDLRARGYDVLSPVELDEADGFEPSPEGDNLTPEEYASFLARDIEKIAAANVDAIVVLPGWEKSGGAKTEVAFVRALGKPVLAYPYLTELHSVESLRAEFEAPHKPTNSAKVTVLDQQRANGNPKDALATAEKKVRLDLLEPAGDEQIARVMEFGAITKGYGVQNYLKAPVRLRVYIAAIQRHLNALKRGEDFAEDSGLHHLAHVGANVHIVLAAEEAGTLIDDRDEEAAA